MTEQHVAHLPCAKTARVRGSAPRDQRALAAVVATALVVAALAAAAPATAFGTTARFVAGKAISPLDERGQLGSGFGDAVALSAGGDTALIGGPTDGSTSVPSALSVCSSDPETGINSCDYTPGLPNPGPGAVWVYQHSGRRWSMRQRLTPQGETGGASGFGSSIAISTDGRFVLVGGPEDGSGAGAVWVFHRTAHGYVQVGAKLTAPAKQGVAPAAFGASVALSANGVIALVGAPGSGAQVGGDTPGTAWAFTRAAAGGFAEATAQQLYPTDESTARGSSVGTSVALSANGAIALLGGPTDGSSPEGAAWVFARHGGRFTQEGAKLAPDDESADLRARFGTSVALSAGGTTALIGGPGDHSGRGAAWVFDRLHARWQQRMKLTAQGEIGGAHFGAAVALSRSGALALVGGPNDDNAPNNAVGPDDGSGTVQPGAAWLFTRSGGRFRQHSGKLTAPGSGEDEGDGDSQAFGQALALSASGTRLMIGGPLEGFNQYSFPSTPFGAAWPFAPRGTR